MKDNYIKRISRLVAILTELQTRRILTSTFLAEKFGVSVRTIYRDVKALEQAGVPILTEDGKGYSLMEGYRIPPVMFTESEANALVTAEQLVLKNRDSSLVSFGKRRNNDCKHYAKYSAGILLEY
jgi:predicted DNA-binding transcriptional regulator YafY